MYYYFLFMFIGIFFLLISFFPDYYRKPVFQNRQSLQDIFEKYPLRSLPEYSYNEKERVCYLLFLREAGELRKKNCYVQFRDEVFVLDFQKNLDYLMDIAGFFIAKGHEVVVVSEDFTNSYAIFLSVFQENITALYLKGELSYEIPFFWHIVEPRLCFFLPEERCIKYRIQKFVQREEFLKNIRSVIYWTVDKNRMVAQNNVFQKSLELFHRLGSGKFLEKYLLLQ